MKRILLSLALFLLLSLFYTVNFSPPALAADTPCDSSGACANSAQYCNADNKCEPKKTTGDKCESASECGTTSNGIILECRKNKCTETLSAPPPPCAVRTGASSGPCKSFNTAFGELPTDAGGFISKMFAVILAGSGAIALILMMRAGYKIMMSQGKPETVQEGRDQLTSAIVGLLFIIFAFVFLELIGVSILRIPDLGGAGPEKCRFERLGC